MTHVAKSKSLKHKTSFKVAPKISWDFNACQCCKSNIWDLVNKQMLTIMVYTSSWHRTREFNYASAAPFTDTLSTLIYELTRVAGSPTLSTLFVLTVIWLLAILREAFLLYAILVNYAWNYNMCCWLCSAVACFKSQCVLVTPYGNIGLCQDRPTPYPNQCWLIFSKVPWHLSQGVIIRSEYTTLWDKNDCVWKCFSKTAPR